MEKQYLFEPYGSDDGSDVDGHHDLHREDDSLLPIPHDSQPSIMFKSDGETQQYSSRRKTHRHKVISGILIVPISIVPLIFSGHFGSLQYKNAPSNSIVHLGK